MKATELGEPFIPRKILKYTLAETGLKILIAQHVRHERGNEMNKESHIADVNRPYSGNGVLQGLLSCSTLAHPYP